MTVPFLRMNSLPLLLVVFRSMGSLFAPLMDCDEVFNYYEPLHFVTYGVPSMQTWEYDRNYALRTFAFLLPSGALVKALNLVKVSLAPEGLEYLFEKPSIFHAHRVAIAMMAAYAEWRFINAVRHR